jgi:hypothetical protein
MVAEQRAPSLALAEAAVKTATETVLALAREHAIAEADVDTSDFELQPV